MTTDQFVYYKIADFPVKTNCQSVYMRQKLAPYQLETVPAGAILDLSCPCGQQPEEERDRGGWEYNTTFLKLNRQLVAKNAFCFHASAIAVDGRGILFSADSGVGKSTQAALWKRCLPERTILQLNDDKPIIRFHEGIPYAYGTPWSGKHGLDTNASAPVKALVFLEQAEINTVEKIPTGEVLPLVMQQVLGCRETPQEFCRLLDLLDRFIRPITVYRLHCNISRQAVETLYNRCIEDGVIQ